MSPCQGRSHWHHSLAAVLAPQELWASGIFLPGRQPPLPDPKPGVLSPARPPGPSSSPASAHGSCRAWRPERPVPGPEPRGPQGSKFGSPARALSHLTPPSSPCEPPTPPRAPRGPAPFTMHSRRGEPDHRTPKVLQVGIPFSSPHPAPAAAAPPLGRMTRSMRTRSCLFLAWGKRRRSEAVAAERKRGRLDREPVRPPPPFYRNISYWDWNLVAQRVGDASFARSLRASYLTSPHGAPSSRDRPGPAPPAARPTAGHVSRRCQRRLGLQSRDVPDTPESELYPLQKVGRGTPTALSHLQRRPL